MLGNLGSALRAGARAGTHRTMPVAVLLVALVVFAAGIGGTSHFTGARWFPHFGGGYAGGPLTGTRGLSVTITGGGQQAPSGGGAVPTWLVVIAAALVTLALVTVAAFVWRWWQGRRRLPADSELDQASLQAMTRQMTPEQVNGAEPEPEPERLLTGIELALEVLDQGREPADAVVRAWLGLQETAQESGIVRRKAETPTEFTARILGRVFVDDRAVRTLLRLYLRARFGDHPVTAQDVTEVREALRQLVSSWQPSGGAPAGRAR